MPSNWVADMQSISFFPSAAVNAVINLKGSTIQFSDDNLIWTTLFTYSVNNLFAGWNTYSIININNTQPMMHQ